MKHILRLRFSPLFAALMVCSLLVFPAASQSLHAQEVARAKPGPKTIRGVAESVKPNSFTLVTVSHGSYYVHLTTASAITEKGHRERLHVVSGDHVGVHGFLHGRSITAISVRIYPTKPKPRSLSGTLLAIQSTSLDLSSSFGRIRIYVTSSTAIRLGTSPTTLGRLPIGDRVDARVVTANGKTTALSIHALKPKPATRHTELRGTVTAVSSGSLSVRAGGKSITVRTSTATSVRYGSALASLRSLKSGETVTVYAYHRGSQLVATSIHIHKSSASTRSVDLRGRVASISGRSCLLGTSNRTVRVQFSSSTIFQIGVHPAKLADLRVGDQVSIRARVTGRDYLATRVHVYAASRVPKSVTGTLIALQRATAIVVTASGRRYQIVLDAKTSIVRDRRRASAHQLHAGDHVSIKAKLDASGRLLAVSLLARAPALKPTTVRGTLVSMVNHRVLIREAGGTKLTVTYSGSVVPLLHGKPAPANALFPGVEITVRGTKTGNSFSATSIRITVTVRKDSGHITRLSGTRLVLSTKSGSQLNVDIPPSLTIHDGSRRIPFHALEIGTYVSVTGYEEVISSLRATSVRVVHPAVNVTGLLDSLNPIKVRTSTGTLYTLHLTANTDITVARYHLPLSVADIPTGVSVHAQGTIETDGEVGVSSLTVHLQSETLRGHVTVIDKARLTLEVGTTSYSVRPTTGIVVLQGTLTISLSDLVTGDEVTAYGLTLARSILLTRKILVHRRRIALDGTVASVSSAGFVMQSADGKHEVLLSPATSATGAAAISPGMLAHVTGYLRGDGSILALKVRLTQPKG